jgi:hypothetical protein
MRHFIPTTLMFLFLGQPYLPLLSVKSVAAQDIQQSQISDAASAKLEKLIPLQIPDGTLVEIEVPYRVNSKEFKPNDEISFRVINAIKINGVTVIEQGANATGRIEQAKRGGHFGKAGLLVWSMQSVTTVDGSQVPLRAVR